MTLNPPDRRKLGSAGRTVPGVEIRIEPSAVPGGWEQERGTGGSREKGEILARGPGVFCGYRNMPEETDEVFPGDGWFCTGDLGYFDEDGYLYVTGRASTSRSLPRGAPRHLTTGCSARPTGAAGSARLSATL